jgi:hypothetical protein
VSIQALALAVTIPASADLITPGTPFTLSSTNATTTESNGLSFVPGATQTVGTTNIQVNIQTIAEAGGQEWLLYSFTSSLASLAGNVNANWELQIQGLNTTQPVSVNHFFVGWGANGALYNPTSGVGVNLPIETNPITGIGQVFGEPITGLVETVLDGSGTANTFAALIGNNYTQNPNTTNFFQIGELIGPVPTPLPAALPLFATGLGALGLLGWRRKRKARSILPA